MSQGKRGEAGPPKLRSNAGGSAAVSCGDARILASQLHIDSVDVTITSPPYFDMKDYGAKRQLGFGQSYEHYLRDLAKVFALVHSATKKQGSLWLIVDTFRRNNVVQPLPFDIAGSLATVGWSLRDVVIWKKDRTLPWLQPGMTRRIFEYVLVFAKKDEEFRYFPDRERNHVDIKRWWIRYPERYSPKGKSLEEVWTFDIPLQGSWSREDLRHFCPFPQDLVRRIINLTTDTGDTVLDPFAGSGTVPIQAKEMGRIGLGFEINARYVKLIEKRLRDSNVSAESTQEGKLSAKEFEKKILDLRILKFGRLLYRAARQAVQGISVSHVLVRRSTKIPKGKHDLVTGEFALILRSGIKKAPRMQELLAEKMRRPPFSKFGIAATVECYIASEVPNALQAGRLYSYSATNSHQFLEAGPFGKLIKGQRPVLSGIRVYMEEPDG